MPLLLFTDDDASPAGESHVAEERLREMQGSGEARYLMVRRGRLRVKAESPSRLVWHGDGELRERGEDVSGAVFLGCHGGRPCFAVVPVEPPLTADNRYNAAPGIDSDGFIGLYEAGLALSAAESRLAARAVHFANWINRTRYCGACGTPMRAVAGGQRRVCTNSGCRHEEFPRTDPVIITLVTRGDRCLLGRQARFPPRRYAPIAGFVAPGETLEAAVRREVYEEVGLDLRAISYEGSQPWPFPASLMFGCIGESSGERVALNDGELEDARWFDRSEIAALSREGADTRAGISLSPKGVMSRQLIETWLSRSR